MLYGQTVLIKELILAVFSKRERFTYLFSVLKHMRYSIEKRQTFFSCRWMLKIVNEKIFGRQVYLQKKVQICTFSAIKDSLFYLGVGIWELKMKNTQ